MNSLPATLAIDVGNSRIKCGLLEPAENLPHCRCLTDVAVGEEIPWRALIGWVDESSDDSPTAVISGSNASRIEQITRNWPHEALPPPLLVDDHRRVPLQVEMPNPDGVGIDRLLNAVAANRLRPTSRAAIIVDCGTATTVDLVSPEGTFAGGAILPGLRLSAQALHEYTDRLPLLDPATLAEAPHTAVGRNTVEAIHSGLYWGQLGAIGELVRRMSAQFPDPLVLLTGGGSETLHPHLAAAQHEPHLTLQGLALTAAGSS